MCVSKFALYMVILVLFLNFACGIHLSKRHISPSFVCHNKGREARMELRGVKYWVLYNYIRASKVFHCNETITLTTHGTYSYMKNLYPLLKRWQGPVSIAVFAPGHDHSQTINTIMFFFNCLEKGHSTYVRELVTFHIFFPKSHLPPLVFMINETYDFS